jgi:hypothetical protein
MHRADALVTRCTEEGSLPLDTLLELRQSLCVGIRAQQRELGAVRLDSGSAQHDHPSSAE